MKLKVAALLCMMGLVALGGFATGPAHAALLDGLFGKKPAAVNYSDIYPIQSEDEFYNVAKSIHRTPYNDPQIEFEIMMPKDWVSEEIPQTHDAYGASRELMGDIAKFISPVMSTMRALVTVKSIKLEHEISAENWLKGYILSNKYNLQGAVTAFNDRKATAECISTALDGSSSYIYVAAHINGSDGVLVQFESPLALKDVVAVVRKLIVDNFKFILETDRPIENLKSFNFANGLKFRYPESLILNHVDDGDTRHMSMQLYNIARQDVIDQTQGKSLSQIQGLIRFIVVKRNASTSLKKETDDIKSFVKNILGLEITKLVSSDPAPVTTTRFLGKGNFSRYEVYQASPKRSNAIPEEIRFVALGDKKWYIFGLLFTPSDAENFYAWAVNIQDFDMMIKDFK